MSFQHLSVSERETIGQMSYAGASARAIARELSRSPSTISRGLRRNSDSGRYSAHKAQQRSMKRRSERRVDRKLDDPAVASEVRRMLTCDWSPETVAGRLRHEHPGAHKWHESAFAIRPGSVSTTKSAKDTKNCVLRHREHDW